MYQLLYLYDYSYIIIFNFCCCECYEGHAVAQLVEVARSIPDGIIGIFHCHNPSIRTVAMRSTQPLNRNEYQEYFMGGKGSR